MQTGPVSLLSLSCHPGRPGVCRTRNVTGRDSRRQALPARHLSPSGAEASFQAPVSAGVPPPAVGPGQSRAPPRLPGHPAHTSVSSCATRKVTVGRKVPSGLSLPTRHPRPLPAPDCRAEAGRGGHLRRGPHPRHWDPGGCPFSRVFASLARCPPSPFAQAQGPAPLGITASDKAPQGPRR